VITQESYGVIKEKGGIGDCCSHFLNSEGEILDPEMDKRVIAAPLSVIRKIPNKLLVAVGKEKAMIIRAALIGNLVDSLYIDAPTAEEIIRLTPV